MCPGRGTRRLVHVFQEGDFQSVPCLDQPVNGKRNSQRVPEDKHGICSNVDIGDKKAGVVAPIGLTLRHCYRRSTFSILPTLEAAFVTDVDSHQLCSYFNGGEQQG